MQAQTGAAKFNPHDHSEPVNHPRQVTYVTGANVTRQLNLDAAAIQRIAIDLEAFESLASGMSEGLRAGVVDPDHIYTLFATQATAIRVRLVALATEMRQRPVPL